MRKSLKIWLALLLAIVVTLFMALPAIAAPGKQNGPPVSVSGPIYFTEDIGGVQVTVDGYGSYTGHILRPSGDLAKEESWFKVTQFTGKITLQQYPYPPIPLYFDFVGSMKIVIHNGNQPNQPIITMLSSEPVLLYVPGLLELGYYSNIQIIGWEIIHAE